MSTTIDQRVVEMRFDNQHFEKNVSTTMSSLDKLKQSLNLTGASKGLSNLSAAAGNVNMSSLANSVETVRARFSALEVMGVTALANITNSAVNAGKRMISALTIDPVKTGLQEYETQMNAVQTILANTQSKGTTLNDVNDALDELNKYADQTIYNFTEMTRNIGTFTAAGVGLKESVSAIKGIANLAAVSGSTSQQASTAMYQLSQALATGTVRLQDWNSVVNAGMGGEVFQNALVRTAATMAGASENVEAWRAANIDSFGSFRDSLTEGGWLTTEVLTKTLEQFTMYAQEGTKEWEAYKESLLDQGYTEKQAEEILKMANTATDAATKVKTFTQLWDVMKESVQSGWSQTWKLIIGDFEEAKSLLSPLAETLTGFIGKISDARNNILEGVLNFSAPWQRIMDKLEDSGLGTVKKVAETVSNMTHGLEYFQDVVNKVWRGDYMNSDTGRFEMLEAAGYDHRVVQDLVNKGLDYKLTMEDVEASHKKFGLTMSETTTEVTDLTSAIDFLTDKQLEEAGLTKHEIRLYRDLAEESKRTGKSIGELADEMSNTDGRQVLVDSFKNAGSTLIAIFGTVKNAWSEIFDPISVVKLYNALKAVEEFSEGIKKWGENKDNLDKLTRSFKGLFAVVDIITTVVGGGFKMAFNILSQVLSYFDMDILDLTARIGDTIVKFRDWIDAGLDITGILDVVVPLLISAAEATKEWFGSIKESDSLQNLAKSFADTKEAITSWFKGLKDVDDVPQYILEGLVNGLKNGAKLVFDTIVFIGKTIIDAICGVLGIQSPSTVFFAIGGFVIAGLIAGLLAGGSDVQETVQNLGAKIAEWFGSIDFGGIFAGLVSAGMTVAVYKFAKAFEALTAPLKGVGEVLSGTGEILSASAKSIAKILKNTAKVVKSFARVMNAIAFEKGTEGVKNLAVAVGILVVAVIALTFVDKDKLVTAVNVITILASVLAILAMVTSAMSKDTVTIGKNGASVNNLKTGLLAIAASMLMLGIVVKMIGSMDPEAAERGIIGLIAIVLAVSAFMIAYGALAKDSATKDIGAAGSALLRVAGAMMLLAVVAKIIANMTWEEMGKAGAGLAGLLAFIAILALIGKIPESNLDNVSSNILKIALAIGLLALVSKLIANMSWGEMGKAAAGLGGLVGFIALLTLITKINSSRVNKVGPMLLQISAAIAILAVTAKIIATMTWGDMGKAAVGLAGLSALIVGLVWSVSQVKKEELIKVGTTLLTLSASIGILALVVALLGFLKIEHLVKGLLAVTVLGAVMAGLILATSKAQDCKSNLIVMAVAIGVMAAAIAALSLIDSVKLIGATLAMSMIMGMFALLIMSSDKIKGSLSTLIVLTVAIGIMAGALYLIGMLPVEASLEAATGLSLLLITVSAALMILSNIPFTKALGGAIALTVIALPLFLFASILAKMDNLTNAMTNAQALSLLVAAMALAMIPLTAIGAFFVQALAGVLALTAMALPLYSFVSILAKMEGIQNAEANVGILTTLMTALTMMLTILAIVGPFALVGVIAVSALISLITTIGLLVTAVGALMTEFPQIETFIDTGIPILEKLALAIGSFIGSIITGFIGATANTLPILGAALSGFMLNAMPFIVGIKMVDSSVLAGVGYMAGVILALTAADLIAGISSFVQGGSSFSSLGAELSAFMLNAMPFITLAKNLDPAIAEGVKSLAEVILILTAADVLDGLTSWFTGGSALSSFGAQLPQFGSDIAAFVKNLGTFNDDQVATITCAANAIKAIAEAATELPNEGGWAAKIFGDNSLSSFGSQLPGFATSLNQFAINLGTFDQTKLDNVTYATDAITAIAKAASELPNEGGWAAKIFGDNSLATFGSNLPGLGTNLGQFATNLGTFNEDQVNTVKCAADAIAVMAKAAESIDGQPGWAAKIFGDNSLSTFGTELASLGENLKAFSNNLGTFDDDKVASIDAAVRVVKSVSTLADSDLKGAKKNMGGFGDKLVTFAEDITSFCENMPSSESISNAISDIRKVLSMIKDIAAVDANAVSDFTKSLKDLGKNGVKSFTEEFTSSTTKSDVKKAGAELTAQIIKGVESKEEDLKTTFTDAVKSCVDKIKSKTNYDKFKSAGSYLVGGFAQGIKDNKSKATAEAQAMVDAVEAIVREGLDINSPSKVFIDIGSSIPEGFALGIEKMSKVVSSSSIGMSDIAIAGVKDSLSRISDAINSDVDAQPTIRPVIDMSDVETKANAINHMFNNDTAFGVTAKINAISTTMNSRQNGTNDDVVSAIRDLRNGLNGSKGDTYIIDGITYDDGSAVSEAMKVIVRKAITERRV